MPRDHRDTRPSTPIVRAPAAVVFDLDGTLVDSRTAFAHSMNDALASFGRPQMSVEALSRYLGPPIHETFTELLGVPPSDDNGSAELVAAAVARYREHNHQLGTDGVLVFDGVRELLSELRHAGMRMAVATSKVDAVAELLLRELGLLDHFEVVSAPAPDAVRESKAVTLGRALVALGDPRPAVMVGDRHHDVEGAAAHGLPAIGVLWGAGSERELREAGAAALAGEPAEILALLGR